MTMRQDFTSKNARRKARRRATQNTQRLLGMSAELRARNAATLRRMGMGSE